MFGFDQRARLLRQEGWTADALAQELYAMFGQNVPNNTSAPIQVTLPTGATVAPIVINNAPDAGPAMQIVQAGGTVINFNNDGTVTSTAPGATVSTPVSGGGGGGGGVPVWG